mgnify:CR=1 FL=1
MGASGIVSAARGAKFSKFSSSVSRGQEARAKNVLLRDKSARRVELVTFDLVARGEEMELGVRIIRALN